MRTSDTGSALLCVAAARCCCALLLRAAKKFMLLRPSSLPRLAAILGESKLQSFTVWLACVAPDLYLTFPSCSVALPPPLPPSLPPSSSCPSSLSVLPSLGLNDARLPSQWLTFLMLLLLFDGGPPPPRVSASVWLCNRCSSASTLATPPPSPRPLVSSLTPSPRPVLLTSRLQLALTPCCRADASPAHILPAALLSTQFHRFLSPPPSTHLACNYRPPYPMDPYEPFSPGIFVLKALSVAWFLPFFKRHPLVFFLFLFL